jgi:hypothetical protein
MPRGWPSAYELYAEGYAVGVLDGEEILRSRHVSA